MPNENEKKAVQTAPHMKIRNEDGDGAPGGATPAPHVSEYKERAPAGIDQAELIGALVDDVDLATGTLEAVIKDVNEKLTDPALAAHPLKVNLARVAKAHEVLKAIVDACRGVNI